MGTQDTRVVGVFGWEMGYVMSIGIICSPADPGGAQTTKTKVWRAPRNPQHPLRIPGGPILANTSSQVVAASSLSLPTRRIPTVVTGAGKARRVRGAAGAQPLAAVTPRDASAHGTQPNPAVVFERKAAHAGRAFLLGGTNATSAPLASASGSNTNNSVELAP